MAALGIPFAVEVSKAEDSLAPQADPTDPVPIAAAKAQDISGRYQSDVVLAGDTIVTVEGIALGKPGTVENARRMLRLLRGKRHAVRTGLALATAEGSCTAEVAAPLTMREYSDEEIDAYVVSGEPLDCAGAYDIHRQGGRLIADVEGCFSAIVGLPIVAAVQILKQAGVEVDADPVRVCSQLYGRHCLAADAATRPRCLADPTEALPPHAAQRQIP